MGGDLIEYFDSAIAEKGEVPIEFMEQKTLSLKYLDEQIKFYHNYYTCNIKYELFFSDHGNHYGVYKNKIGAEDKFHVFMGITGNDIVTDEITSIQSLKIIPDIMISLLKGYSYKKIIKENEMEYAPIQCDDVYSVTKDCVELVEQYGVTWQNLGNYFQYRGVITKEDCYIRWASGIEYYERNSDLGNVINDCRWAERISFLRQCTGNKYINTYKEEKYKCSRKLYKMLKLSLSKDNVYI